MARRAVVVLIAGFSFALMLPFVGTAGAVVVWNEAVNGPLGEFANQTQLGALRAGDSEIIGTTGQIAPGVVKRVYFSFNVPAGLLFSGLNVVNATSGGPLGTSFIGIGRGTMITVPPVPTPTTANFLLGYRHYSLADIGTDILPEIGNPMPRLDAETFTVPLPAGNYAIWIQETGLCTCVFDFDFVLTPVPEPVGSVVVLTGLAGLAAVRRTRRRRA